MLFGVKFCWNLAYPSPHRLVREWVIFLLVLPPFLMEGYVEIPVFYQPGLIIPLSALPLFGEPLFI